MLDTSNLLNHYESKKKMIKELKRVLFVSIVLSIMLIISMINASSLPRKKIGDKATCACCNVVLQEIRKDIDEELYSDNNKKKKKKKKNVEELVIESMSQICTEVKRFVTYNYPPSDDASGVLGHNQRIRRENRTPDVWLCHKSNH